MHLSRPPMGRHFAYRIAGTPVIPSPPADPPFTPEVLVVEEDTWRLLSAPCEATPHPESLEDLTEAAMADRPDRPGAVRLGPHLWQAIVYDLDQDTICRPEWVTEALGAVLAQAHRQGAADLAMGLLGSGHGGLPLREALALLLGALAAQPQPVRRIWLQCPAAGLGEVTRILAQTARD